MGAKFRGRKTKGQNRWVEGSLLSFSDDTRQICEQDCTSTQLIRHWVISKTVGQYTGLKDKNGTEIFAGDIVSFGDDNFEIVFADACFWIRKVRDIHYVRELHATIGMGPDVILGQCGVEVIGNIHDNPELLKVNDG